MCRPLNAYLWKHGVQSTKEKVLHALRKDASGLVLDVGKDYFRYRRLDLSGERSSVGRSLFVLGGLIWRLGLVELPLWRVTKTD